VLDQCAPELIAGRDDDFSVQLLLQLRDLLHDIALGTVELFQSGSTSVDDTTYLGMLSNLSASAPVRGRHRAPKNS